MSDLNCIWWDQCGGELCAGCEYRDDGTDEVKNYIEDLEIRHQLYQEMESDY